MQVDLVVYVDVLGDCQGQEGQDLRDIVDVVVGHLNEVGKVGLDVFQHLIVDVSLGVWLLAHSSQNLKQENSLVLTLSSSNESEELLTYLLDSRSWLRDMHVGCHDSVYRPFD